MDTALFHRAVGADHLLLDGLITAREPIYRSPNGKTIERFRLRGQEASCIFKPLTNEELLGRERWAQRELLPRLRFRYPRLLAEAAHEDPATYWIILEDAGSLSHAGEFDVLAHAVRHVSSWQRLPAAIVPAGYAGQKPLLPEVLSVLARERSRLTRLLAEQGVSAERIAKLYRLAGQAASLPDERVVSHGDLHIGNVALLDGEAVILDWEHVQLNSPFWDLYCLLDMTHPSFRRTDLGLRRYDLLRLYEQERNPAGGAGAEEALFAAYDRFACLYSAWFLLLIDRDLEGEDWDRSLLLLQRGEALRALLSCLDHSAA